MPGVERTFVDVQRALNGRFDQHARSHHTKDLNCRARHPHHETLEQQASTISKIQTNKASFTCIGICFAGPMAKSQAFLERKEFNAMAFSSSASVGAIAFVFCFLDVDAIGSAEV